MAKRTRSRPKGQRANETAQQYRERRYRELHPGASKQQARGHKPREHVERKQKEIERYGMPLVQQHAVEAFAREQAAKNISKASARTAEGRKRHEDHVIQRYLEATRKHGYDQFVRGRQLVRRLSRQKRLRGDRALRSKSKGGDAVARAVERANRQRDRAIAEMQDFAEDFFDDADDDDMLYYH